MKFYNNTIELSQVFTFTSSRRLTEQELLDMHKALVCALPEGVSDNLLDALREQVPEDADADDFCGYGPEYRHGRPTRDELSSTEDHT